MGGGGGGGVSAIQILPGLLETFFFPPLVSCDCDFMKNYIKGVALGISYEGAILQIKAMDFLTGWIDGEWV